MGAGASCTITAAGASCTCAGKMKGVGSPPGLQGWQVSKHRLQRSANHQINLFDGSHRWGRSKQVEEASLDTGVGLSRPLQAGGTLQEHRHEVSSMHTRGATACMQQTSPTVYFSAADSAQAGSTLLVSRKAAVSPMACAPIVGTSTFGHLRVHSCSTRPPAWIDRVHTPA